MANRIYLDEESYKTLNEWSTFNAGYVLSAYNYFDKVELILKGNPGIAYVTAKPDSVHIEYRLGKDNGTLKGFDSKYLQKIWIKMDVRRTPKGKHDYSISFSMSEQAEKDYIENSNEIKKFLQLIVNSYLIANAFLIYGNLTEEENRVLIAAGNNDGEDKVIVFRKFEGKTYAVQTTRHRSLEGIFSVRGHFRKYKSGKVVWIDQYLKGLN